MQAYFVVEVGAKCAPAGKRYANSSGSSNSCTALKTAATTSPPMSRSFAPSRLLFEPARSSAAVYRPTRVFILSSVKPHPAVNAYPFTAHGERDWPFRYERRKFSITSSLTPRTHERMTLRSWPVPSWTRFAVDHVETPMSTTCLQASAYGSAPTTKA